MVSGQERIDILQQKIKSQSGDIPHDRLYLHTDRNLYHPGDTIYFQSYIYDRFNQQARTSSKSSYVLLIDSDNEIIDSARFRIKAFLSPGYLLVPGNVNPGYYRIVSYTSLMQGYNPTYAFSRWIRIDNLFPDDVRVDFSFDKSAYSPGDAAAVTIKITDESGDILKNESFVYSVIHKGKVNKYFDAKTNRRGESLVSIPVPDSLTNTDVSLEINLREKNFHKRQSLPMESNNIDLRFLPEGGTYTYGFRQRLAFNAVDHRGKQLIVSGLIKNDLGEIVDTLRSILLGPGMVDFTPVEGRSYFAELDEYPDLPFKIPEPSASGPVLRVNTEGASIIVEYKNNDGDNKDYILALLQNSEILSVSSMAGLSSKVIIYKLDDLPRSSASLLLFDSELNPVAERLIHINSQKEVNAEIKSLYNYYAGGQEAELEITLKDIEGKPVAGIMSVSVVDSATAIYPDLLQGNIEDEFLFDRGFYVNLPLSVRSGGLSNLNQEDLDILLLTYGWKRFTWKVIETEDTSSAMNYYDNLRVKILDRISDRKKKRLTSKKDNLFLFSVEDPKIISFNSQAGSYYYLPIDSLGPNTNSVFVVPESSTAKLINSIRVDFPHNREYFKNILEYNAKPHVGIDDNYSLAPDFRIYGDSIRIIDEVVVRASRKPAKRYINQHEKTFRLAPTTTLSGDIIKYSSSFEELLRQLMPNKLNLNMKQIELRTSGREPGKPPLPVLFILDGTPLGTNYQMLCDFPTNLIHSVTAVKGLSASYIYGQRAIGGAVFVETKMNHYGDEYEYDEYDPVGGDIGKSKFVFRPFVEYYTPTQQEMAKNPENWLKPTLYWNYNLIYDGTNPIKIKYPNHKRWGIVKVSINGVTENSIPVSRTFSYEIK